MRRVVAALLLLCMLCQSVMASGQPGGTHALSGTPVDAVEWEHDLMHWEGIPHHHDDHDAVLADDSQESVQHLLADGGPLNAMPWQPPSLLILAPGSSTPPVLIEPAPTQPHLDGPRRPPRFLT